MVTVIIPTYKRCDSLDRAINSVINQSYTDWEIIVVDDNSFDSPERIEVENKMKKYKNNEKIKYIKHEKNKNGSAARNTGIANAKGEYIAFLDDDDFYLKNRLEIFVNELEKHKEYDAIYSSVFVMYRGIYSAKKSGNLQRDFLMQTPLLGTGSNLFFRKNVFDNVGLFDESFQRHQDIEFLVRFFRKGIIKAIDKILVVKDDSLTRNNWPNMEKALEYREKFLSTFMCDINNYKDVQSILDKNYLDIALKSLDAKNFEVFKVAYSKIQNKSLKVKTKVFIHRRFSFIIFVKRMFDEKKMKNLIKKKEYGEINEYL